MASTIPPKAEAANADTLANALKATSISSPAPAADSTAEADKPATKKEDELEDGEIREDEEDDGKVKTVFDDASKFNVKVGWF